MQLNLRSIPRPEATAAAISLSVGISLMVLKFVAYALTGSAVIFSDALESIVNVLASGFALGALAVAHRPANELYPYGHGKIEFLSAAFEGGMILLAAVAIIVRTLDQLLIHKQVELEDPGVGLILMAAAMLVNGGVGGYLVRTGRRHNSMTLEADGKHLLSDAITSIAAIAALGIVKWTGWVYADPLGALLLAGYLVWMSWGLLRQASAGLMDRQDLEDEKMLRDILDSHQGFDGRQPRICSYHKLRHRHSGRYHWVDFHIMVPSGLTIEQGHNIASTIEYEIEQRLGEGNATAHIEPCTPDLCQTDCPIRPTPRRTSSAQGN